MRNQHGMEYQLSDPILIDKYIVLSVELSGYPKGSVMPFDQWVSEANAGKIDPMRVSKAFIRMPPHDRGVPFWTFAKVWAVWDEDSEIWYPTRLGLGAYGDSTAWHRDIVQEKANGLRA